MAFEKAMSMMGKKSGVGHTIKGADDKSTPHGKVGGEHGDGAGDSMSLHAKGDGTYETSDGEQHEHLGKALMHFAQHHEPGAHSHIHHDGFEHHTHHVTEGGEHHGPHSHGSMDEAADHLKSLTGEEGHDAEGDEEEKEPAGMTLGGY